MIDMIHVGKCRSKRIVYSKYLSWYLNPCMCEAKPRVIRGFASHLRENGVEAMYSFRCRCALPWQQDGARYE